MDLDIEPERREQYRAGDIRHCFADPQRAERILGFSAKTSFEDGMTELIAWLEEQHADDQVDDATAELTAAAGSPADARSGDHHRLDERGALARSVPAHGLRARG